MLESEARKKWCPFTRALFRPGEFEPTSYNRRESDGEVKLVKSTLCVTQECMAWKKTANEEGNCSLMGK